MQVMYLLPVRVSGLADGIPVRVNRGGHVDFASRIRYSSNDVLTADNSANSFQGRLVHGVRIDVDDDRIW